MSVAGVFVHRSRADFEARTRTVRSFRPEVGRFWIRRAFRDWPGAKRRWVDLTQGAMGRSDRGASVPDGGGVEPDGGLLYVPPVEPEHSAARDLLVSKLARRGVPMLVQVVAGGELAAATAAAAERIVVDPLAALLERRLDALDRAPAGAVAVWPLVAGLTDAEASWSEGCRRFRNAGVVCVQPLVLEVSPDDRRELAGDAVDQHDAAAYSRLFHGHAGNERRFAAVAASHGLDVFYRRGANGADRKARNSALAELLALAAELRLRLGHGEVPGQELFRASRWVEETAIDVRALAIERNLEIVEALRPPAVAEMVAQWAAAGASSRVDGWLAEYVTATSP